MTERQDASGVSPREEVPLVTTIRERCRVCYTCVRECPAKAIRISNGQAEVLPERCIGCGNCVRVCSQGAKRVLRSIEHVQALLDSPETVVACVAPSFPAEFEEIGHRRLVGMVRALGFDRVCEVAFGADLTAARYRKLFESGFGTRHIAANCPAVVSYVERYHPALVSNLAPVVSPMIAAAKAIREIYGADVKVVFIGPCIAKKAEAVRNEGDPDAVLTFAELREMLDARGIGPESVAADEFDPPQGAQGALFPITRGMLQAANIEEDLLWGEVVSADGRRSFVEAIKEFESGDLDAQLLEVLCCDGCIMGPGMTTRLPLFSRRSRVSRYVRERQAVFDRGTWREAFERCRPLNLTQAYKAADQRVPTPRDEDLRAILARMGKLQPQDELNCGACGYDTCREHAIAIHRGLAENEMCLPYTIEQLRKAIDKLAESNEELARVQDALVHSEKLASMGQLAAGIAHEVNNPLGVVLMYAHLLLDRHGPESAIGEDATMIAEHADRCKKIVSGLLNFARQNRVVCRSTDLRSIVEHAVQTLAVPSNVEVRIEQTADIVTAEVDPDQITQVVTNLATNALAAMSDGGVLTLGLDGDESNVRMIVRDTGVGIPADVGRKVFEPFFTTKPIGRGTGLGLSVTYGIVKMHRGDIDVESNADAGAGPTGTTFTVTLPRAAGAFGRSIEEERPWTS